MNDDGRRKDPDPGRARFTGCVLGLAIGDALGAPHEGGPLERALWRAIGKTRTGRLRWTDDTQMALDLGESLLENGGLDPDDLAARFAAGYRWSRGYGRGTARTLRRIRSGEHWRTAAEGAYVGGSYGNGAAVRAPILALFFRRERAALIEAARASSIVTHSHPHGVEGAQLIALAAHALLAGLPGAEVLDAVRTGIRSREFSERIGIVSGWIAAAAPKPRDAAIRLGNGASAPESCATALMIALLHRNSSFETMMEFVIACGGDTDSIGAMAGALWGAANGDEGLPDIPLESRERLEELAVRIHLG